jgi:hypothetical protein
MASTLHMMERIAARLKAKVPDLTVEFFPERPAEYRLNHPRGALLVSYLGSQFAATRDATFIAQPRTVKFAVTVVLRQLNGRGGAIDVLDEVRRALVGFKPPDCRKVWAVSEKFLGETAGLWQYAVDFASEAMLLEDDEADSTDSENSGRYNANRTGEVSNTAVPLTQVHYKENP